MKKRTLALHKRDLKILPDPPVFALMKRGKLPKPLHQIGGPRVRMTQLLQVAEQYSVWFMWKDGETVEQTAFYAYLFRHVGESNLYPLCHFHWHPSHKPLHIKTPCGSDLNYTNRSLPSSNELHLKPYDKRYDPRIEQDRLQLVEVFCRACGIQFGKNRSLI
jgi:hypothetical protein